MEKEKLNKLYNNISKNREKIDRAVANEIEDDIYDEIVNWIIDILKNSDVFDNININWKNIRNGLYTVKDEYIEELHDVMELYVDSTIGNILNNMEDLIYKT